MMDIFSSILLGVGIGALWVKLDDIHNEIKYHNSFMRRHILDLTNGDKTNE